MFRKIFYLCFLFILSFFAFACGEQTPEPEEPDPKPEVPTLEVEASVILKEGETYTINVEEAIMLSSAQKDIISYDETAKTITALKAGEATVTVYLADYPEVSKEIKVTVEAKEEQKPVSKDPTHIEIAETVKVVYLDDIVDLEAVVFPEGASQEVEWKALNRTKALVSEEGIIEPLRKGSATFVCSSKVDSTIKAQVTVEIVDTINPERFFSNIAFEKPVVKGFTAYGYNENFDSTLLGSITKYMFEDFKVNENFMAANAPARPGTPMKPYYVTVHDVGGTHAVSDGQWTSNYCNTNGSSSWHFSVGNDGAYQSLPMDEVAWHAGDGTGTPLKFTDTGIKATSDYPAKVTISSDGYWEFNGEKSSLQAPMVPIQHYNGSWVTTGERRAKTSDLPYTGINTIVGENGNYFMGNVWWSQSYQTLSNRGGNLNSVGIETSVSKGSNIFYTWNVTAKLISTYILPGTGLQPKDVRQHNTFSGKDCPMTMRHANMWETFLEIVEAEYYIHKYFKDWNIELVCDSPFIAENGLIKSLPDAETTISYQVKVSNGSDFDKTYDFSFVLPAKGNYKFV